MEVLVKNFKTYCYTNSQEIDPGKKSILFIHGSGMDHTVWTLAARHFARRGNNVISVDLPAHGRSAGSALASIEEMAEWSRYLLKAVNVEQVAIVGHSLGSLIALECAASFPDRVRSIAMVGTTCPMPVSDAILDAAKANDHSAFDMLTQWGFSKRNQFGGNRNSGIWMTGNVLRLYERSHPGVLYSDMTACNEYTNGISRASLVQCPTLLILGSEDRLTPVRGTESLKRALPHPSIEVLSGSGHTIMMEAPNTMLDALHRIL